MTSLYYVTEHIKLVGKWAGIGIAVIIGIIFLFRFIFFIKEIVAPTPPPPATVTWGKLPPIKFAESKFIQKFSYKINTLSGDLPSLPDRLRVNLIATPQASLQSLNNAQNTVTNIGFDDEGIRISETFYQWLDPQPPQKKLQYDIVSKNFGLSSNYMTDPDILAAVDMPDEVGAQKTAEAFLTNLGAFPADFDATKSATTFLQISNNTLTKTTSLSNAQIIRVDFFQKDVNNLPIYYPQFPQSPIYVLVGAGSSQGTVVESEYAHHTITDTSSTYPIMTAAEGFKHLEQGDAFVARYDGTNSNILIQDVKLGYYLDRDTDTYLMPIMIFEGNDNFTAYVSAIREEWINK